MSIENNCNNIRGILDRIARYNKIVRADSFSQDALGEMKDNCRDLADNAKAELDKIKAELDNWQ